MSARTQRTRGDVVEALERVGARPEFDLEPSLFQRGLEWLLEHLIPSAGPEMLGAVGTAMRVFGALLAALLVTLITLAIVRRVRRARAAATPAAARWMRVAEMRALALQARDRGELALALRYLLCALVVGLGQRGDLDYRDAWTNRELFERGDPTGRVRGLLLPLVLELEAKEFGREPVEPADVQRLSDLCELWLDRGGPPPATGAATGAAGEGAA